MATNALNSIASEAELRAAWGDISRGRKNRSSYARPGLDGESLRSFDEHLDSKVLELQRRLRARTFQFSALQPIFVPKGDGRERLICVPCVADRLVQRTILNFLRPKSGWMANGMSFGFVPDLSVTQAAQRAVKLRRVKPWIFKTDITAFFDMIDRDLLRTRIATKIRHKSILKLIQGAIECEIHAPKVALQKKLKTTNIREGRGVRQGMPLSPYFANLMLEPFDKACLDANYDAVRYADDLAFFAGSEDEARAIGSFCVAQLEELRLQIPELTSGSKTQIYPPNKAADFLGLELAPRGDSDYELRVSSLQMSKIKERLYHFGSLNELRERNLDITRFGSALESTIRSYEAAYEHCANLDDLRQHLEACRQNAIASAMQQLGINLSGLSESGRWFLGVHAAIPKVTEAR